MNTGNVASTTMALALVTSLLAEMEAGFVLTVALLAMVSSVSGVIFGGIAAGHKALSSSVTTVTVLVSLLSGRKTE